MKKCMLVACMLSVAACATQGDLNLAQNRLATLEGRLSRLEAEYRDTRSRLENYQTARKDEDRQLREQSAQLYATLEQLKEENRSLSGRIEEIGHSLRLGSESGQISQKGVVEGLAGLESRIQGNSDRIQRMEQYLNLAAPPAETAPAEAPGIADSAGPSEEAMYAAAKKNFDEGDFKGARRGFQSLLEAYPQSKNADNAQFWIGETFYRENWYEKAILEYQKVIEKYPGGNKVRAALLKQGLSFFNIGDKANARLILKELISKYPQSEEAALAEKKLKGF
jgi:tol-pal system protein YbgF